MFIQLLEQYNALWTNPENPNAILMPFTALAVFAMFATTLLTNAGKERYSRYLSITVFCATSLISLILMNLVAHYHSTPNANPYNTQYVYSALAALNILASFLLYYLHKHGAKYFSSLFFWVFFGMLITALFNLLLFIKLVVLNWYYDYTWFHILYTTVINGINLVLIIPFIIDAAIKLSSSSRGK